MTNDVSTKEHIVTNLKGERRWGGTDVFFILDKKLGIGCEQGNNGEGRVRSHWRDERSVRGIRTFGDWSNRRRIGPFFG